MDAIFLHILLLWVGGIIFFLFLRSLTSLCSVPNNVVRCQRLVLEVSLVGGWSGLREIVRDSGDSDRFESWGFHRVGWWLWGQGIILFCWVEKIPMWVSWPRLVQRSSSCILFECFFLLVGMKIPNWPSMSQPRRASRGLCLGVTVFLNGVPWKYLHIKTLIVFPLMYLSSESKSFLQSVMHHSSIWLPWSRLWYLLGSLLVVLCY